MVHAADKNRASEFRPLNIRVQAGGFGGASVADITAVLQSTAGELSPILAENSAPEYRCVSPNGSSTNRFITRGWKPDRDRTDGPGQSLAQYSFQFAHEFCHALANYSNSSRRLVRYPRDANLWLEESLCETASLFTLRAMGRSWQTDPPHPAWREDAVWLNSYAKERLAMAKNRLPPGTQFSIWFRENQSLLRHSPTERSRNTIIAMNFCRFLKQNHAAGKRWHFSTARPVIRRARWRSILPGGVRDARRSCDHL